MHCCIQYIHIYNQFVAKAAGAALQNHSDIRTIDEEIIVEKLKRHKKKSKRQFSFLV